MKTTCTHCGARYALPDHQAERGRRIRCRKCGTTFAVPVAGAPDAGPLQGVASAAVARSGPRRPSSSADSEGSAMFSLAALAQNAVERPRAEPAREDSDLIDLSRVRTEARDATVTPVPTAIPLLPLGVDPLGTTPGHASSAVLRPPQRGLPPWTLVAGSVAIAAVILAAAFVSRSSPRAEVALAMLPSATAEPDPRPAPIASASATPAPSASAPAMPSAEPPASATPAAPRPPLPPRPPIVERNPPPPPPPPVKPANPCAHCGTDLSCSMACRVKGG